MGYEGYASPQERIEARNKLDREYEKTRYDVLTVTWDEKAQGMREIRQSDGYYYDEGGQYYNRHQHRPIAYRDPKEWKVKPDMSREFNHPDLGWFYGFGQWDRSEERKNARTQSSREIASAEAPLVDGYTLHRDVPFKEIRYPYTDEDNRYHKHRNKNSYALDGRS